MKRILVWEIPVRLFRWALAGSFVALFLLAVTGLLMVYVLPPGSHQSSVWGLSRHEWGDLHF